jgi:LysM repeat protein
MKKIILITLSIGLVLTAQYKKHTVVKGDCLWDIAGFYYNNPFLWPVIYEANKDSIADPHWIYPGEVFVIPNVPAEQASELPVKEGLVMEVKGTKTQLEEESAMAKAGRVTETAPETEEISLFSVVQAEEYAFTKKAALEAGFITKNRKLAIGKIDKLIKSGPEIQGSPTILGDKVQINKGTSNGVQVGDDYVIFEWGGIVGRYGRIVKIKGILKILEAGKNASISRITDCYERIKEGDLIMKYTPPEMVIGKAIPTTYDIKGKIIAFKKDEVIVKPFSVVYIEPGKNRSVQLGDVFLIYKEQHGRERDLLIPLGQIQIVNIQEETASGYITTIMENTEISRGNKIRLVGRIGG